MVRLRLLDVDVVAIHQVNRLEELDVVDEAHQLVLAAAEGAPEIDDAEAGVDKLNDKGDDAGAHKPLADLPVLVLQSLELFDVLRLFLDVIGLLVYGVVLVFLAVLL